MITRDGADDSMPMYIVKTIQLGKSPLLATSKSLAVTNFTSLEEFALNDCTKCDEMIAKQAQHLQYCTMVQEMKALGASSKQWFEKLQNSQVFSIKHDVSQFSGLVLVRNIGNSQECEVDMFIDQQLQGKLVASWIMKRMINYLKTNMKMAKINVKCHANNVRGKNLLNRLQFKSNPSNPSLYYC